MLILSRKKRESIIIGMPGGREITVCVVGFVGDKVKIGIEADSDIPVHRKEVWDKLQREDE